ncbi:MAG: cytidylate kinase [Candidatus Marinimicrobia bacterium]|nr:cytidylate kinase [Candidatus Neomarinimicrobiota bacterium]|tara:strand:+ start:5698 stop:6315 length:618 start_codon:yes stop_codon:yes gene_type:complete
MNKIIITIDGPSGSGKTTLGRAISKKLGITFFSSGSIYRVITKYFLDTNSLGFDNFEIISFQPLEIQIDEYKYFEQNLYTKELNTKSSELAQQSEIRAIVNNILKFVELSADTGLVVEGRDMGSVVFPDATLKIYLDADENIRSARRVEQSNNEETTVDIAERDKRDISRKNSPLIVPKGAITLKNNTSTVDELVDEVIKNLKLQ